ncbi:MAG: xylulokinase [Verrucomicrobiae bacterium]|nr:xylulokinase [Verrucomicrobiae bacterium]MCP5534351.1 xylulokinase [Akkermansiaceae bacterium]MCP5548323.1 xylulokinase [Akkermansiaceae bacterium]
MHFLGLEIGHGGTRAVVLDIEAAVIRAEAWVPHDWIEGLPAGYREQNPAQWIDAVDRAARECLESLGDQRERIAAVGVGGPQRGLVLLDESNRIIRPAKLAGDISVKRQAEELARAFGGAPGLIELAGHVPGTESAAAELLWLKQHEPYHFQRATRFLTAQDFIAYWLTGEQATEAGSASTTGFFDVISRTWSKEILDFIDDGLIEKLPVVGAPDQPRGLLRPALARDWGVSEMVQVGAGSAAPMLAALAAGCVAKGTVAVELGATGVIAGVGDEPVIDYRGEIVPLCSATGSWLGLATSTNAAVAPEVLRRHYGWSPSQFESMVSSVPPGADGLLMLPYFSGESIPRLPEARGIVHGLNAGNFTPAHMARATAEGVALGLGYAMSRLRDLGFDPPEVRLLGPGASSGVFRQLLADVLGAPVVPVSSRQGAAVGAAMHAAVAFFQNCGESLGFGEIVSYLVSGDAGARCEPDETNHQLYQELMSRQQYLVDTLHPAGFL